MDNDALQHRFSYHPPKEGQAVRYQMIRSCGEDLARLIVTECPESREASQLESVIEAVGKVRS